MLSAQPQRICNVYIYFDGYISLSSVISTVSLTTLFIRTSYGISAISTEDNVTVLCSVEDITDEQNTLAKPVELCNTDQLSIEHLQNVVDDFLCAIK